MALNPWALAPYGGPYGVPGSQAPCEPGTASGCGATTTLSDPWTLAPLGPVRLATSIKPLAPF